MISVVARVQFKFISHLRWAEICASRGPRLAAQHFWAAKIWMPASERRYVNGAAFARRAGAHCHFNSLAGRLGRAAQSNCAQGGGGGDEYGMSWLDTQNWTPKSQSIIVGLRRPEVRNGRRRRRSSGERAEAQGRRTWPAGGGRLVRRAACCWLGCA